MRDEYMALCHLYNLLCYFVELGRIGDHFISYTGDLSDLLWDRSLWVNKCFVLVDNFLTVEYYNADLSDAIPIGHPSSGFYIDDGIIFQGAMML